LTARTAEDVRRIPPGRDIPSNQEAEQSVLGSMMLSTEAVAEVIEEIKPDDFYWSKHRRIYDALVHLYSRGEPVDQVTAVEELKRRGQLEEVGALYIHELVANVPTPASARYYAKIVHELALLRRLIDAAGKIMELAFGSPEDPESVADHAEELIYSVARRDQKDEVVVVRSLVDQTMEELEHIHQRESAYSGIPSGFRDLDELLSGLQKSNLIVVAARPGVGKSSFVTNLVRNVTVEGTPAALFSLEMSRWEIGMRLLCGEARVPWDRVRAARVSGDDWSRIAEAAEVLHDLPLWIVDAGNVTILDVRAKARRLKSTRGLGLIVVDYLQLMTHHGRADNRQQEVAEISRGLKLLAKELEIPVIAVSQLNRDPERRQDKRPQLSDLRECVTGDTPVTLADGRRVPIRDLVGTTPEVLAATHDRRIVPARSDLVWSVGTRPVYRVRLSSGREVRATTLHRFLGPEGWVRVKELRVGARMAVARRIPEPARPERWPEDRVVLLGQVLAHGVDPSSIGSIGGGANREVAHLALRRSFAGAGVAERWLTDLGLHDRHAPQRRIPYPAFRLPNDQVGLLLRHLWAGSGSIYVPGEGVRPAVFFSSTSAPLARDIAALLGRFGILATIRTVRETGVRPVRSVHVVGKRDQRSFLNTVGAFGDLASSALRLGAELEEAPVQVSFEEMSGEDPEPEAGSIPVRSSSRSGGTLTVERAPASVATTLTAQAEPEAASDVEDDVVWDVVDAIEPIGDEEVFDLTVPGPASWLADGVVSHNSGAIEQDSDIVVFIHRDDAEESTKNVAELIVAKHRNGPTGQVKLTFLPNLTQFRNYASGT
jgi:replicative DNA helicase